MSDSTRFGIYEFYPKKFGVGRSNPSKDPFWDKPKDRPWWPMRYFMDDWILSVWVYRIRHRERCEVGLFLAEDHTKYVKDSGIKGGLICPLTQTFHLLGKMEVHFVGPRHGQEATCAAKATSLGRAGRFVSDPGDADGNQPQHPSSHDNCPGTPTVCLRPRASGTIHSDRFRRLVAADSVPGRLPFRRANRTECGV